MQIKIFVILNFVVLFFYELFMQTSRKVPQLRSQAFKKEVSTPVTFSNRVATQESPSDYQYPNTTTPIAT